MMRPGAARPLMRETPLAGAHGAAARGTMDLLGWAYPAEFSGAIDEHHTVRTGVGLFDFSFMSHFLVHGPDAFRYIQRIVTNDAARLAPGSAIYSPICRETGTFVDDCTVIRRGRDEYLITTGLARTGEWLEAHRSAYDVALEDHSSRLAVIAVQGPLAPQALASAGVRHLDALAYFRAIDVSLLGQRVLVARIGVSGELGYELFVPVSDAFEVWRLISAAARAAGLRWCGGLALDSLRIEAGYLLTQVDFDESVTPVEAGLTRFVKLGKGDFIGRDALIAAAPARRLAGLAFEGGHAPERGATIRDAQGQRIGRVTSACLSPTLGQGLALGYLDVSASADGCLTIDEVPARVSRAALPFYDPSRRRTHPELDLVASGTGPVWRASTERPR